MSFTADFVDHTAVSGTPDFVPELWSDEVIATYKANLVMANLVTRINHAGKKGDTLHIPGHNRGTATAKAEDAEVTLIAAAGTGKTISIDKHFEYSRLIEDFADVQALSSLRQFYTDDAGYALAKQVDTDLIRLGRVANGGADGGGATDEYANAWWVDASGVLQTTYNDGVDVVGNLSDVAIRSAIQILDDLDVPFDNRYLLVPPVERNNLMGIARFTEQAFVGEVGGQNTIRNGMIGEIYGIPVYVSTNCETSTAGADRICLLGHKEAGALVDQMSVRTQTQYMQQYLANLLTADTIYGVGELRDDALIPIAVAE